MGISHPPKGNAGPMFARSPHYAATRVRFYRVRTSGKFQNRTRKLAKCSGSPRISPGEDRRSRSSRAKHTVREARYFTERNVPSTSRTRAGAPSPLYRYMTNIERTSIPTASVNFQSREPRISLDREPSRWLVSRIAAANANVNRENLTHY